MLRVKANVADLASCHLPAILAKMSLPQQLKVSWQRPCVAVETNSMGVIYILYCKH